MANRDIIEKEGLYYRDYMISQTALNNLNSLYRADPHLQDSIFYQSQSEPQFHQNTSYHSYQTNLQQSQKIYDVTVLQTSRSLLNNSFDMAIDKQILLSQNTQIIKRVSQTFHPSDSEKVDENPVSKQEQPSVSDFICRKDKKRKKIKNSEARIVNKKSDKEKNIFPNVAKRNAKIIFEDCKSLTENYCRKRNIKFDDFEKEYKSSMDSNCSGLALSKLFIVKKGKEQIYKCFMKLFEKYLKKRYMVLAITRGKMDDLDDYIGCKNRQLMYFSNYINSNFQLRE